MLFIEKEGFAPLLQAARIAERFDVAVMSTKGMSTTAARLLLDRLAPRIDKVLVLHDFDVSGFSIFGTLGSDGRRYRFENELPIVDLGLRLADVEAMGLQSEPVETPGDWAKRAETLAAHGATEEEIAFLRRRRVELNAMPADVFVGFLERKLAEHGVRKVVPDRGHPGAPRAARDRAEARRGGAAREPGEVAGGGGFGRAPGGPGRPGQVRPRSQARAWPGIWPLPPSSGARKRSERRIVVSNPPRCASGAELPGGAGAQGRLSQLWDELFPAEQARIVRPWWSGWWSGPQAPTSGPVRDWPASPRPRHRARGTEGAA